jgi:AcrR family transcriptional regulator
MDQNTPPVKTTRSYNSSSRAAQAERSRLAVLDAAMQLFLEGGYGGTTVGSIAAVAGVSVEMIYKNFGGKAGIVRAASSRALSGDGAEPTEAVSDRMRNSTADPRDVIAAWSALAAEVLPRVAPILLVVRSAASTDSEMAQLRHEMEESRLRRMETNARHLAERGHLRPGVTVEQARDVMFACTSPELFELLALRQGWSLERYAEFIANVMIGDLLPSA